MSHNLTPYRLGILAALARGETQTEIATRLGIAATTISTVLANARSVLGVRTNIQAVAVLVADGTITVEGK